MTVTAPDRLFYEYVADGLATERSIGFPLRRSADLVVAANGVPQVLGQHYIIVGSGMSDQRIKPLAPFWPNGAVIGYWRHTTRAQEYDVPPGVDIRNESLEDELDRMALQQQEQDAELDRAVKVPRGETISPLPEQAERAGKFLAFDADGNLVPSDGTGADAGLRTDLAGAGEPGGGNSASLLGPFAILPGWAALTIYDRLGRRLDALDAGALIDNTSNAKGAIDLLFARLVAQGGGIAEFGATKGGAFAVLSDVAAITVAGEQNIKIVGQGRDQTILRVGGAATRGPFRFRSTTTTPNRLPRFDVEGLTIAASGEKLEWAIDAEWAINGDIEDPFNIEDVAVQQYLKSIADDGTDYGYFYNLIRVKNARNSNIRHVRLFGDTDRAPADRTARAISIEGECTSFRVDSGYILEAQTGIITTADTEGLFCNNIDMVGVDTGVDFGGGSVLEPQFTWAGGHINALECCINVQNTRYFRIVDTFLAGKAGWNAQNLSKNWTGVKVQGALTGWGVIDAEISKEEGHGYAAGVGVFTSQPGGATSTAVDVLSPSVGVEVRGSVHAFTNTDPIDFGVILRAGVTKSLVDIQALNVTADVSYTRADGNSIIRRQQGEYQVAGGNNQFLSIIAAQAAWLKFFDEGGGANLKEGRFLFDGGALQFLLVNDNGSTKKVPLQVGADGTPTLGDGAWNGMPLKLGGSFLWVDASGRLRIKGSAPTSDTDGTIVGTQL